MASSPQVRKSSAPAAAAAPLCRSALPLHSTASSASLASASVVSAALACVLLTLAGCKTGAGSVDDATLTRNIQTQLAADTSISGQPIQATVANGVATLNGSASNDAQRTIAARDAAGIAGVKEVVNNIAINAAPPASAQAIAPPPAPIPVPTPTNRSLLKPQPTRQAAEHQQAPIVRQQDAYNQPQQQYTPQPAPQPAPAQQAAPPPPPKPTFATLTIPSGNTLPIRVTQTLDSATTQADTTFSGVLASDIVIDGLVALPAGTPVSGHVDAVQEAAHFKGSALLTVSLTSVNRHGDHIAITTEPYTVTGKGRGTNTAEKTGGGAAVGAILGGIFGGGKGAAIGAAAGGGVGAGSNGVTRGQQVQIQSESVVRFRLANSITVRVRTDQADRPANSDPSLEHRPPS